jgi:glutamine amidotransferase
MAIALVDFGAGNLRSVEKALGAAGAEVEVTADPQVVLAADKVILPGVGSFADGRRFLEQQRLLSALRAVARRGTPLLGICLGMQLLFERGEEHGDHEGLGLLPGTVRRLPNGPLKVPHTGWNRVRATRPSPLLEGLADGAYAYFNHSYFCDAASPADVLAGTAYGLTFPSVVQRARLFGVQFHPEKSQRVGLTVMRNFVERC